MTAIAPVGMLRFGSVERPVTWNVPATPALRIELSPRWLRESTSRLGVTAKYVAPIIEGIGVTGAVGLDAAPVPDTFVAATVNV